MTDPRSSAFTLSVELEFSGFIMHWDYPYLSGGCVGRVHRDLSDAIGPIAATYAPLVGCSVWSWGKKKGTRLTYFRVKQGNPPKNTFYIQ